MIVRFRAPTEQSTTRRPREESDAGSRELRRASAAGQAVTALAIGAVAFGALAIGALALGRLAIGRARIHRLEIDNLIVRQLHVTDKLEMPPNRQPES